MTIGSPPGGFAMLFLSTWATSCASRYSLWLGRVSDLRRRAVAPPPTNPAGSSQCGHRYPGSCVNHPQAHRMPLSPDG